jgi:circadian clock protein KaiC
MAILPQKIKPAVQPLKRADAKTPIQPAPASRQVAAPQQAQADDKVSTGIGGLDELIGGGLEHGSTTLVMGDAGCGKTTFLTQFLYNGAVKEDEPGVLLSFEEPSASIVKHMRNFGFDFAALEEQNLFQAISYRPHEVKKLVDEGGGLIWDTIASLGAKRLAIDSLTSYAMMFETIYRAREAEILLFELLHKWGCTTLLSAEGLYSDKVKMATGMEYLCDGVIHLHHPRYQASRYRAIEIIKMRGTKHSEKLCPFEFIEGEGIRVYPGETVFYDLKKKDE